MSEPDRVLMTRLDLECEMHAKTRRELETLARAVRAVIRNSGTTGAPEGFYLVTQEHLDELENVIGPTNCPCCGQSVALRVTT